VLSPSIFVVTITHTNTRCICCKVLNVETEAHHKSGRRTSSARGGKKVYMYTSSGLHAYKQPSRCIGMSMLLCGEDALAGRSDEAARPDSAGAAWRRGGSDAGAVSIQRCVCRRRG
jgi:hypothetical protein